jgi:hypothetical protein
MLFVVKMKNLVNIVPQPQQHPQDGEWGKYA